MHAPLLRLRDEAACIFAGRLKGTPLQGYRFPYFSGEEGMSLFPSAEQFSKIASGSLKKSACLMGTNK